MEYIIGAALLATGVFISRVFESLWPSKEAERQREASLAREERQARRSHRAENAKPVIELIDRISRGHMLTWAMRDTADDEKDDQELHERLQREYGGDVAKIKERMQAWSDAIEKPDDR